MLGKFATGYASESKKASGRLPVCPVPPKWTAGSLSTVHYSTFQCAFLEFLKRSPYDFDSLVKILPHCTHLNNAWGAAVR